MLWMEGTEEELLKLNKDSATKGYEVGKLYLAPRRTGDSSVKDVHTEQSVTVSNYT